jgi:hypothetical protein
MAQQIRISIQASDPATAVELNNEFEALRGHEPKGAELIEDPAPRPRGIDAQLATTVLIALVAGMGGAVGKELADSVLSWFIERMRAVAARRKSPLIVTLGDASLTVDEHTVPAKAAAQLAAGLR